MGFVSAHVTEALRAKRDRDGLLELVQCLEEEHGPVTGSERSAAYDALSLAVRGDRAMIGRLDLAARGEADAVTSPP